MSTSKNVDATVLAVGAAGAVVALMHSLRKGSAGPFVAYTAGAIAVFVAYGLIKQDRAKKAAEAAAQSSTAQMSMRGVPLRGAPTRKARPRVPEEDDDSAVFPPYLPPSHLVQPATSACPSGAAAPLPASDRPVSSAAPISVPNTRGLPVVSSFGCLSPADYDDVEFDAPFDQDREGRANDDHFLDSIARADAEKMKQMPIGTMDLEARVYSTDLNPLHQYVLRMKANEQCEGDYLQSRLGWIKAAQKNNKGGRDRYGVKVQP